MRGSAAFRAAVAPGGVLAGPWVRNELWRRARAVPSLDLRFAETKSLGDAVSGQSLVTFTRASSGTYVGSDGLIKTATTDAPRFDHNPTTGESLGLLVEESRTNLILASETYQAISFTEVTTPAPTNDTEIAPDGNQSAFEYPVSAANRLQRNYTVSAGATYTFSFFAKQGNGTEIISYSGFSSGGDRDDPGTVVYNWTTNTLDTNWNKENYSNGWSRFFKSYTSTTGTTFICRFDNGSGGVYFWGFELEAGAFVTSYIPTTTATVTRSADVASISGSNFSSWYRQDEGTVFGSYRGVANIEGVVTRRLVEIGESGVVSDRMILGYNDITASRFLVLAGSSIQAAQSVSVTQGNQIFNAAAYKTNDFINAANGTLSAGDTSGTVPAVSEMVIGNDYSSGTASSLNGTIARLVFWPQRLSDSTLANITQ